MEVKMIELKNVNKSFHKKLVLNNLNYTIGQGVYGLLGPNGAGKTTLMRTIVNLQEVLTGEILVNGENVRKNKKVLRNIGYLPQKFGVFTELTVWEMMNYFANLKKIPRGERKEQIEACLEIVNLSDTKNRRACKLSGGMIRRLGIAQALLGNPDILLLDEPTSGLDPEERMRFKNIISKIGKEKTILISTHIVEDVEACCNHIIVMKEGMILAGGTSDAIRKYAEHRICEADRASIECLQTAYYIEKEFERDNRILCRAIVKEEASIKKEEPTIEDGYMCLLKGEMFNE